MNFKKLLTITLIALFVGQLSLNAQVKFLLDIDAEKETYIVSILPEMTWKAPYNNTVTAQITLKAPTGAFEIGNFESLTPNVTWVMNSIIESPKEAPEYDYFSFSLVTNGLEQIDYVEGKPTKLFCFKNTFDCSGEVALINNETDPFLPPNSRNANVGNSLSVLGAKGEAYTGNVSDIAFNCDFSFNLEDDETAVPPIEEEMEAYTSIFPNPTSQLVNIHFSWDKSEGKKDILIYNNLGELVQFYTEEIIAGDNQLNLNIDNLTPSMYQIILIEEGRRISLGKVIKVR